MQVLKINWKNGKIKENILCRNLNYYKINNFQSQEVEETLKRIASHKGVVGTIVVNNEGKEGVISFLCQIIKIFFLFL